MGAPNGKLKLYLFFFCASILCLVLVYDRTFSNLKVYRKQSKTMVINLLQENTRHSEMIVHNVNETYISIMEKNSKLKPIDRPKNSINSHWQELHTKKTKFGFIRNIAWLDKRTTITDTPCIRIHFIHRLFKSKTDINKIYEKIYALTIFIQTTKKELKPIELKHYTLRKLSRMQRSVNGMHYIEHLASFPISKNISDKVIHNMAELNITIPNVAGSFYYNITIKSPLEPSKEKGDFFICVKPLYKSLSRKQEDFFIEWAEMNKILGVEEIHIYNHSLQVSQRMNEIIEHYKEQNILHIHQFQNPFPQPSRGRSKETYTYDSMGLVQRAALNSCFYNNINRFRFMISVDLDEIIIPQKSYNYNDLFNGLKNNLEKISSMSAYYSQFYQFLNKSSILNSNLLSMTHLEYHDVTRTLSQCSPEAAQYPIRKSFISTDYCTYIDNHWCEVGYKHSRKSFNPSLVKTHHYRDSCKANTPCNKKNMHLRTTTVMEKYKEDLEANFSNVTMEIDNIMQKFKQII